MKEETSKAQRYLLFVGRWHGVTRDQQRAFKAALETAGPGEPVFVITGEQHGGTKRHPLHACERKLIVEGLARSLGRPARVYTATDISDGAVWVSHILASVSNASGGATVLTTENTVLVSANPDVNKHFVKAGFRTVLPQTDGKMPVDLLAAVASQRPWEKLATRATRRVFKTGDIVARVRRLFDDVLLNEDGELSHGRDFTVYSQGMDASMAIKVQDICPHVRPGKIVDKGCGTGTFLIHLSALFPNSEIVGMDLSRELLHMSESHHFPNHNVAVVKGNIIQQRFADGSLSTVVFSSVMHEVFSYNGYDRDQIRLTLANTRRELQPLGRIIIRDGIKPAGGNRKVWLRCKDAELEERFRKFAREFKGKSAAPGFAYEERVFGGVTYFGTTLHEANEFLSKKDYLTNWAMEVNEEFGVWTKEEWEHELTQAGYRVVHRESYLNPWIEENRYHDVVWLHADEAGLPGAVLTNPDTTAVIVAERV